MSRFKLRSVSVPTIGFGIFAVQMAVTDPGWAQNDGPPVVPRSGEAIEWRRYDAPASCPGLPAFQAELLARQASRPPSGSSPHSVAVDIQETPTGFLGTVQVGADAQQAQPQTQGYTERKLEGADCADLVGAMALVAVVLMDSELGQTPAPKPSADAPPAQSPLALPMPASREDQPKARRFDAGVGTARRPIHVTRHPWKGNFSGGMGLEQGVAPEPIWEPEFGLRLGRGGASRFAWEGGLVFSRAGSGAIVRAMGDAHLRWTAVRAEFCGGYLPSNGHGHGRISLCATLAIGQLFGEGETKKGYLAQSLPWVAPGLLVRGEVELVGPLAAYLETGLSVPLVRSRFYFREHSGGDLVEIHRVPVLITPLGLGLSVRFP